MLSMITNHLSEIIVALEAAIHIPALWIAVGQIIGIDIVLAGDNAVIIALACRMLAPRQRLWGMILGAAVAVAMRIVFTMLVTQTMDFPYIKIVGGILLIWVAVKLVVPEPPADDAQKVRAADNLMRAVWIIAVADIVMSLDNVIAIAAMASNAAAAIDLAHAQAIRMMLIVFGLLVSIPLVVAGSALVMSLLERWPILIWVGAGILGWAAGDIIAKDDALKTAIQMTNIPHFNLYASIAGAAFVLMAGYILARRRKARTVEV